MELKPELIERIHRLNEKYQAMGQDLTSYLDGLLYADYLTYWDYIHLDTLLSLQTPKTSIPDEKIFIMYHQITELYLKLCMLEYEQIGNQENITGEFFLARVNRIIRYYEALTASFDVMVDGMEQEQFLKFRMSLLPASGFQSGQFRMVEICSCDFMRLIPADKHVKFSGYATDSMIEELYKHLYWRSGATELATGKRTLTLEQFEKKYAQEFIALAKDYKTKNVWAKYKVLPEADQKNEEIILALRKLDVSLNVNWRLVHYKSAVRYLQRNPMDIAATGGTNWQKYLPPRFQKISFYPELWTPEEIENWGKSWVESVVFQKK